MRPTDKTKDQDLISDLRSRLGEGAVLDAQALSERQAGVWRPDRLKAAALVRPSSTDEVAAVLRYCNQHGVGVVTHGGLTGLVHGADASTSEVILSLERMNVIEHIDPVQRTAVVQAGVILQNLQDAVDAHELAFPLDLGARGSCTLGGNVSTNAGGNRVIRYGMTRDMVLGVETVLADGTIVSSMNHLIKNNAGYDLKHMFIGSEGTLGVVTKVVLRLREKPQSMNMAFVAFDRFDAVPKFLKHMDRALGGTLSAFEVMWQSFYHQVTTPPANGRPPLSQDYPFYALVESLGGNRERDQQNFESAMEAAFEAGLVADAAISQSDMDCKRFWGLRDDVVQTMVGGLTIVFDVSLPISEMECYTTDLTERLKRDIGAHKLWIFGHLGDGNLHVVAQIRPEDEARLRPRIEAAVYEPLAVFSGSVSAEHGIGLEKKAWLHVSRSGAEIALMKALKRTLDPKGILNPGKVL
jgi:FAD/FMN-containing dehydrogenase